MFQIHLPLLFSPHMILQREKEIPVRGTVADAAGFPVNAGTSIRICLQRMHGTHPAAKDVDRDSQGSSFIETREKDTGDSSLPLLSLETQTQPGGAFVFSIPPLAAGTGYELLFFVSPEPDPALVLTDVCIGDLWMACGQSNMEYYLRYDANWQETMRLPRNPMIRMFNVPQLAYEGQEKDQPLCGYWFEEGDAAWPAFSAPGYSFARRVQPDLDIPVGIIGCNWGGTPACAWIEESYLEKEPLSVFRREYEAEVVKYSPERLKELSMEAIAFEDSYDHGMEWRAVMYGLTLAEQEEWMQQHQEDPVLPMGPWHHYRPSGLYHTMIRRAAPFPVRGFLWYQGESDSGHADIYDRTMAALVQCFRDAWQDQSLPFLFVQLAPFGKWLACDGTDYTIVRAAQERAAQQIPDAYMTSIMDLGCYEDIHPKFKMEVGRRLALLALGHVYGKDLLCDPPAFRSARVLARSAKHILEVVFDNTGSGLQTDDTPAEGFELSQGGRTLRIDGCQLLSDRVLLEVPELLTAPDAPALTIAYAWQDYCTVHLWNSAGLAAKPFRITESVSGNDPL